MEKPQTDGEVWFDANLVGPLASTPVVVLATIHAGQLERMTIQPRVTCPDPEATEQEQTP